MQLTALPLWEGGFIFTNFVSDMNILVTNDDGYTSKGIEVLARMMLRYGDVTVVAPKYHQSGMSMAVSFGLKPIAFRDLGMKEGIRWMYLDATPASCTKYAMDVVFAGHKPDVILSGINHGSNSSTAMWYSGTIGAAREGALAGVQAIGVSIDDMHVNADFSCVEEWFPGIFEKLMANRLPTSEVIYNVNFPGLPADEIKGVKVTTQGVEWWENEFVPYDPDVYKHLGLDPKKLGVSFPKLEKGEVRYMMAGDLVTHPDNDETTDNWANEHGYISITPHSLDNTDRKDYERLSKIF